MNSPIDKSSVPFHILLIEDDDDHAQIVMRSFRKCSVPIHVEHILDGTDAIARIRQEGKHADSELPGLVLLDLKLPRIYGLEILAILKSLPSYRQIPIVILTTSDAEDDMKKAYLLNANSYLVKPLDGLKFQRLIDAIAEYWGVWNQVAQLGNK